MSLGFDFGEVKYVVYENLYVWVYMYLVICLWFWGCLGSVCSGKWKDVSVSS